MPRKKKREVAVFVDTWSSHGRGVLSGIHRYQQENGPWTVIFRPYAPDVVPSWLARWGGDGVLASVARPSFGATMRRLGLPVVNVYYRRVPGFPQLFTDNQAIARLAANHLCERGLRNFGFVGWPRGANPRMDERCDCFVRHLQSAGFPCSVLPAWRTNRAGIMLGREHERICAWLSALPKPVGVMACCDMCGLDVLTACRVAGLHVPQDVAVVSTDDDELFCNLSDPPLSSVRPNFEGLGYHAAACLDRLMAGARPPAKAILIQPLFVCARASTDVLATGDKDLAVALHYIRQHAHHGLQVEEVLRIVPLSRSTLEHRMKKAIGRTPKAEIMRLQLERVKELLLTTDLPIAAIAARAGYEHPQYMSEVFRQKLGLTPRSFRRREGASPLAAPKLG